MVDPVTITLAVLGTAGAVTSAAGAVRHWIKKRKQRHEEELRVQLCKVTKFSATQQGQITDCEVPAWAQEPDDVFYIDPEEDRFTPHLELDLGDEHAPEPQGKASPMPRPSL